jgi:hypothetical protein
MIKRMKVQGTITETLIVQKRVSTYIDIDTELAGFDVAYAMAEQAVRNEAYKNTIQNYMHKHGWDTIGTIDVEIISNFNKE